MPKLSGRGKFLGANFGVKAGKDTYFESWWGEGEAKICLDGDREYPTLCGSGTEDYIGTGWGQHKFAHLWRTASGWDMGFTLGTGNDIPLFGRTTGNFG